LKRQRTLAKIESYPEVRGFLNSKARNSVQTKTIYTIALSYFETFLSNSQYDNYNIETILKPLTKNKISVYSLLDDFVGYLMLRQDASNSNTKLSANSIITYVRGVRSYIEKNDIDISSNKFKSIVTLPKKLKRNTEAIDSKDIQTILLSCSNVRLKVFILVLASSGMRANECLSLRNSDIDCSSNPTRIHIRAENTKTNRARDIYISDEASRELKKYIDSKGFNDPNDLVFTKRHETSIQPINLYRKLLENFHKVLAKVDKDKRKDGQNIQRREISLHSFRRFVKTTISNLGYTDFSEWLLGHDSSLSAIYYDTKEQKRREIYLKCMKYLTFLDYPTVESVGKDFESKLEQSTKMIEDLEDKLNESEQNREWDMQAITDMNKEIKDQNKKIEDMVKRISQLQGKKK
jgi:integrase